MGACDFRSVIIMIAGHVSHSTSFLSANILSKDEEEEEENMLPDTADSNEWSGN